jgi:hypothetical protein
MIYKYAIYIAIPIVLIVVITTAIWKNKQTPSERSTPAKTSISVISADSLIFVGR